jgi:hypothetical protein
LKAEVKNPGEVLCMLYAKLGITPPCDAKPQLCIEAHMEVLERLAEHWQQQVAVLPLHETLRDCPKHGKPAGDARQAATSRSQGPK